MLVEKQTVGEIVRVGFQFPTNFQIGANTETAKWINEQNRCGIRAEADAIYRAYSIGRMLLDVKNTVPENTFVQWLQDNVEVSQRHAYNYMAIAKFPDKVSGEVSLNKAVEKIGAYQKELRQIEYKQSADRVAEYEKTGVKPDGYLKNTDERRAKKHEAVQIAPVQNVPDKNKAQVAAVQIEQEWQKLYKMLKKSNAPHVNRFMDSLNSMPIHYKFNELKTMQEWCSKFLEIWL